MLAKMLAKMLATMVGNDVDNDDSLKVSVALALASFCKSKSLPPLCLAPNIALFDVMPDCKYLYFRQLERINGAGLSTPGEGKDTVQQRDKRRVKRVEAENEKKVQEIEVVRKAKKKSGIFLCDTQCTVGKN
jgi:hypothetical protein